MDTKKAYELSQILDIMEGSDAISWLFDPHPHLGGDAPAERVMDGRTDDVLALIDQIISGAYI